jgi:SAM-dependent methyltransferase
VHETSKSIPRRLRDVAYVRWLAGHGIDVGAGPDGLGRWQSLFPLMKSCRPWDKDDGDAQELPGVKGGQYDFLHSSHCLEHLRDPFAALERWCQVVKPGGHVVVLIPDEDLYERGVFPSRFNGDHLHTFTICKRHSWNGSSVNVTELIESVADLARPLRVELLESTFLPGRPDTEDQTLNPVTEAAIEFVLRRS